MTVAWFRGATAIRDTGIQWRRPLRKVVPGLDCSRELGTSGVSMRQMGERVMALAVGHIPAGVAAVVSGQAGLLPAWCVATILVWLAFWVVVPDGPIGASREVRAWRRQRQRESTAPAGVRRPVVGTQPPSIDAWPSTSCSAGSVGRSARHPHTGGTCSRHPELAASAAGGAPRPRVSPRASPPYS
jgi:hypothetical protein